MRLGYLMLFVPDLNEARRFYSEILELRVVSEDQRRLVLTDGGCEFVLFKCDEYGSVGDYSREARGVFVFQVPCVLEAFRTLQDRGVRFLHDKPTDEGYAAFTDPFGIVHEITDRSIKGTSENRD